MSSSVHTNSRSIFLEMAEEKGLDEWVMKELSNDRNSTIRQF